MRLGNQVKLNVRRNQGLMKLLESHFSNWCIQKIIGTFRGSVNTRANFVFDMESACRRELSELEGTQQDSKQ